MKDIKRDIEEYNSSAAVWLSKLVKANYNIEYDFSAYALSNSTSFGSFRVNLDPQEPIDLYRNILLLTNGFSEYLNNTQDKYGRLDFRASFQHNNGIIKENLVQSYIEKLLSCHGIRLESQSSKMIISHDIDTLHNGYIYELYRGIKQKNIHLIYRVLVALTLRRPVWYNIDSILDLLDSYDFRSIFYFIVEQGWSSDNIKNADYRIYDRKAGPVLTSIHRKGHHVGLHKSTMDTTYNDEYHKLPSESVKSNRNHFLRYRIPQLYRDLSNSVLETDCSLCFPYNMGFRNNYGLPFKPFDLEYGKELDILEIPFQVMDGMLPTNNKSEAKSSLNKVLEFLDTHKKNTLLGILWHNTELSEVSTRYSLEVYKGILRYLYESDIQTTTPDKVLKKYNDQLS